jgi:hypothetical protein
VREQNEEDKSFWFCFRRSRLVFALNLTEAQQVTKSLRIGFLWTASLSSCRLGLMPSAKDYKSLVMSKEKTSAAKKATSTIPIVMGNPGDPIQSGFFAVFRFGKTPRQPSTQLVATFPR